MNLILFDDPVLRVALLPFTFSRSISELKPGYFSLREKWELAFNAEAAISTDSSLDAFHQILETSEHTFYINGALLANDQLVETIAVLPLNTVLKSGDEILAAHTTDRSYASLIENLGNYDVINFPSKYDIIKNLWDIYLVCAQSIAWDFEQMGGSAKISDKHTISYAEEQIYIGKNVIMHANILNAEDGPIIIGDNCILEEGAKIRGPFAMGTNAVLSMGAAIRGNTALGRHSKLGGEVKNSVIHDYSNKAHDGYMGNSVLGSWCNWGADTNNSNLKNNYGEIKVWDYEKNHLAASGQQFCGMFMGDHSKCGINTMFNTGTVVGFCANVFGGGFPPKFIPSFAWGAIDREQTYDIQKAIETAEIVLARKNLPLNPDTKELFLAIFENRRPFLS